MENLCYADENGQCKVLTGRKLKCESCCFFKSTEQFEAGHMKSVDRVNRLDAFHRKNIIDKYYGGNDDMDSSSFMQEEDI